MIVQFAVHAAESALVPWEGAQNAKGFLWKRHSYPYLPPDSILESSIGQCHNYDKSSWHNYDKNDKSTCHLWGQLVIATEWYIHPALSSLVRRISGDVLDRPFPGEDPCRGGLR